MTLPPGTYIIFGNASSNTPGTTCALTAGPLTDTTGLPQGGAMTLTITGTFNDQAAVSMSCTGTPGYSSRIYAIRTGNLTVLN